VKITLKSVLMYPNGKNNYKYSEFVNVGTWANCSKAQFQPVNSQAQAYLAIEIQCPSLGIIKPINP
jgi:hypothetical protein